MPKSYTEEERAYIRQRLKEEAAKCLVQYGIRRTTVNDMVKRVGIPKGTFYLFYPSKEMLLFEVIQEQQDDINQRLYHAMTQLIDTGLTAESLTDAIFRFFKEAENMPLLQMLDANEVDLLIRKLPREVVEAHFQDDEDSIDRMLALLPHRKKMDTKAVSAAFHSIYFSTLYREEIGDESYDDALRMLIRGVILQII